MNLKLDYARKYAAKITEALAPFCAKGKIEVAGSIRRGRPECHDIDLVCLPTDVQGLRERVMESALEVKCCGEQVFRTILKTGVQLDVYFASPGGGDLFLARPCNYGTLLLCRTGSAQHNIYLARRALDKGLKWDPHWGVYDAKGKCIAAETEEDVFRAIGLAWVNPERRER